MSDLFKTADQIALEGSLKGGLQWTSPEESLLYNLNTSPLVAPNKDQENIEHGSPLWTSFKNSFSVVPDALVNAVYKNFNVDEDYNAFTDPLITRRGPEFVAKHSDIFSGSTSAGYSMSLLERIDNQEKEDKLFAQNPVSSLVGAVAGGLLDPSTLLLFSALPKGLSIAARVASNSAIGAAYSAAYTGAESTFNPNVTSEDIATSALYGAGLGALIGTVGSVLEGDVKGIDTLKKWYAGKEVKNDTYTPVKVDGETPSTTSAGAAYDPYDALKTAQYDVADTNSMFTAFHKTAAQYAPSERMLRMQSPVMKELAQVLGGTNTLTKGQLAGLASKPFILQNIETNRGNILNPLENNIKTAYAEYKAAAAKKGVEIDSEYEFGRKSLLIAGKVPFANSELYEKAAGQYRNLLDTYKPILKNEGFINKDAELADDWIMHYIDHDKLADKYSDFKQMFVNKVTPNIRKNIKAYLDEDEINSLNALHGKDWILKPEIFEKIVAKRSLEEANEIVTDIRDHLDSGSLYNKKTGSFTAKSLRNRTLNLTNEEIAPYLRDDTTEVVRQYVKSIETSRELNKAIHQMKEERGYVFQEGEITGNPYTELEKLIKEDYAALSKKADGDNKLMKKIDDERESALKEVNNLLDLYTGNFTKKNTIMDSDSVKTAIAVVKWLNTMRLMGMASIAQLGDMGSAMAFKLINKLSLTEMMRPVLDKIAGFTKEEAARLGLAIDSQLANSRNLSLMDIYGTDLQVKGKIGKAMDKTRGMMFFAGGMDWMNSTNRTIAAKDAINTHLNWMRSLVDGTLKPGSYEAIELSRFGFGIDNIDDAKKVLKEFDTHKTDVEKWGVKSYYANLDKWSPDVSYSFQSKLKKYVNKVIVDPDFGSRPNIAYTGIGGMVLQFKGFIMGAFIKQLMPRMQSFNLSSRHAQLALMAFVMHSIYGMMSGYAKDIAMGRELDFSPERMAFYAFDRGGFFPMFDYLNGILDQHGFGLASKLGISRVGRYAQQGALEPLLGPSFGYLNKDVGKGLKGILDGNATNKDVKNVLKLMPLYNFIYWSWLTNNIDK